MYPRSYRSFRRRSRSLSSVLVAVPSVGSAVAAGRTGAGGTTKVVGGLKSQLDPQREDAAYNAALPDRRRDVDVLRLVAVGLDVDDERDSQVVVRHDESYRRDPNETIAVVDACARRRAPDECGLRAAE